MQESNNFTSIVPKSKRGRKTKAEQNSIDYIEKKKKEKDIEKLAILFIENPNDVTFAKLADRINWGLRSYIYKIVGTNEATDSVLSKTLESIYYKRDQFDPSIAKFSTWMYKIALNYALKHVQEKDLKHSIKISENFDDLYESTLMSDSDDFSSSAYTTDDELNMFISDNKFIDYTKEKLISDMYDASISCIKYLPDNLRTVMTDRLLSNKKINDIAEDNNIPISSVKNWLRKGKVVLQDIIKEKYTDLYMMYTEAEISF